MEMIREFFVKGGPTLWPLLACSVASLAVTLERAFFWWRADRAARRDAALLDTVFETAEQGRFGDTLAAARRGRAAALGVIAAGLKHRHHGLAETLELAAYDAVARMKQGLSVLDTVITMAPLLGILGTVIGIIRSFHVLGMDVIQASVTVTQGVAESLLSTAAGITVALLTLVPFNILISKVQRETRRLEQTLALFEIACRKGRAHEADHRV